MSGELAWGRLDFTGMPEAQGSQSLRVWVDNLPTLGRGLPLQNQKASGGGGVKTLVSETIPWLGLPWSVLLIALLRIRNAPAETGLSPFQVLYGSPICVNDLLVD